MFREYFEEQASLLKLWASHLNLDYPLDKTEVEATLVYCLQSLWMNRLEAHDIAWLCELWYRSGGVEVGHPGSRQTHVKAFPTWTRKPDVLPAALETASAQGPHVGAV